MCGATSGEKSVAAGQSSLFNTATSQAQQEFGDSSTAFGDLMSAFTPIAAAGPSQQGWSPAELSTINSAAITNTGAQYKAADTAVKEATAAYGGGNVALPSGAEIAPQLATSEAGAQQTASELNANLVADYQQGNQNWKTAVAGIEGAPGVFNAPNSATSAATGSGTAAFQSQNTIAQAPTWGSVAMGALGDVAGAVTGDVGGALGYAAGNAIPG